jgi:hypothetical protein
LVPRADGIGLVVGDDVVGLVVGNIVGDCVGDVVVLMVGDDVVGLAVGVGDCVGDVVGLVVGDDVIARPEACVVVDAVGAPVPCTFSKQRQTPEPAASA